MIKMVPILLLILVVTMGLHHCEGQEIEFECIDTLENLDGSNWFVGNGTLLYADGPSDIQAISGTNLTGQGIFYFEGTHPVTGQELIKNSSDVSDIGPAFIYFKYYGNYETNIFTNVVGFIPVLNGGFDIFLMTSPNDTWAETMFQIDMEQAVDRGLSLIVWIQQENVFLVDKIIVAQGKSMDIEEIKNLCP